MVCHLTIKMGPVSTNIVTMAMVKLKVRSDLCFFCKFGVKSLRLFVITDITKIKWCLFPTIISSLCLALCQFSNKSLVSIGWCFRQKYLQIPPPSFYVKFSPRFENAFLFRYVFLTKFLRI
jgi:hypothetical protein